MRPSAAIIAAAAAERQVVDGTGRKITVRGLTALDKLRIFKAAGPELSLNQAWLAVAVLASSVTAIDDVPIPFPANEAHIEAIVSRLGDGGLEAVAEAIEPLLRSDEKERLAIVGNLSGTPS